MIKSVFSILCFVLLLNLGGLQNNIQGQDKPFLNFSFNGTVKSGSSAFEGKNYIFTEGLDGQALSYKANKGFNSLSLGNSKLNGSCDFTIQFWVQTSSDKPTVLVSQKQFTNKSIDAQKNAGWVLYSSGGTFAWSIGSGERRLNYERENGGQMPLNDGNWHQLAMTYNKKQSEIRLYYDGHNKAIYKVGFDFANDNPLVIGTQKNEFDYAHKFLPQIEKGAKQLQSLVDAFNDLSLQGLKDKEFLSLIVDPDKLLVLKKEDQDLNTYDLEKVKNIRKELLKNPYTVFQNLELTKLKPISKIYYLEDGKIKIHKKNAKFFTQKVQLFPSDFKMDNLSIWNETRSPEEILSSFNQYKNSEDFHFEQNLKTLNIGVWNIWHGGIHFNTQDHHWDSRQRIVEMIRKYDIDVILMQETYSSGDFIAAELGYYFATTSDWDYCFQGSNISVLSRYPITELHVPQEASFMNVGVKLALSKTQEIYAMSNWYGMSSFQTVYDFHQKRFEQSDMIPVLFGGDFNAVPHTDGGESPASVKMLDNGFTDAYRSLHTDIKMFPGYTHCWGDRIDQLYYKGKGLKNISTEVIHTAHGGFPSDHFLIYSKFELSY